MTVEVRLVQDGMAMQSGTIVAWFKDPGDLVCEGDVIGEVESEKSTLEILAPASGTLAHILVEPGTEVPVRTLLALIAGPDEEIAPVGPASDPVLPGDASGIRQVVPAARRLALDLDIDLAQVAGSGPDGRITPADVRRHASGGQSTLGHESTNENGVVPLTGVRGTVAQRMLASLRTMAQFTVTMDADVTDLVRKKEAARASISATYTDLVVQACALALREHPRLNAYLEDEHIRVQHEIHIGVAVALEEGLVVPVLRNADTMDLRGIVKGMSEIVTEARSGRAGADTFAGGTFTVSSLGAHGIDIFTPVVNPPQVAILGVGRIVERPVRINDSGLTWRKFMSLSLTVDHRAVDGVPAAKFLQTIARYLQDPARLSGRSLG